VTRTANPAPGATAPEYDGTPAEPPARAAAADESLAVPEEHSDLDTLWAAHRAQIARQRTQIGRDARAVFRAMEGWGTHTNLEEDWVKTCQQSAEQYDSGRFLLERLGAERYMDPALMATIWGLRQRLNEELGATTHAERMLIDMAVLSYFNALRVQGWIGNLAMSIEHEFFAREAPSAKLKKQYGSEAVAGLHVEDMLQRYSEQLLPLLDRANRLLIRNLKAVRELKVGPLPNVSINNPSQVNVAAVQHNVAQPAPQAATSGRRARRVTPSLTE